MKKSYKRVEISFLTLKNSNVLISSAVFLSDNIREDIFI